MKIEGNVDGVEIDIDPSTSTDNLRIIVIGKKNKIKIGANCKIAGHIFVANGSSLSIGDELKCTGRVIFHLHEGSRVIIGNNCLMAMEVTFRPSDAHKIIDVSTDQRINDPIPIYVADSV